jgi:AraC family transcriptional regulator
MKALATHAVDGASATRGLLLPPPASFDSGWGPVDRGADRYHWSPDRADHAAVSSAVAISPSQAVIRRRIGWRGMAAETVAVTRQGRFEFRFRAPVHLLVLLESGARSDGLTLVEGAPGSTLRDYQRRLIFVPAGHEYSDWQETCRLPRLALFYFEPSALPLDAETVLAPRLFFEDAELCKTALKLKAVLESPQPRDRSYCEALGIVLAHDLARLVSGERRPERRLRGGLAAWQQQTVARHIEERLAEHVSLATLAAAVRLSPYHFARAFKQSFGRPPHRFHIHRRIERAKALLSNPEMSVTEVGFAVGFDSASSFTKSFSKAAGLTPSDYRRATT